MIKWIFCLFLCMSIMISESLAQEKFSQVSFTKDTTTDNILSSITGRVTDNLGEGVYFYLKINGVYIQNNLASGNFHLKLAPGKFIIEFMAIGFNPTKPLVIEVAEKDSFKFKVVLEAGPPLHSENE